MTSCWPPHFAVCPFGSERAPSPVGVFDGARAAYCFCTIVTIDGSLVLFSSKVTASPTFRSLSIVGTVALNPIDCEVAWGQGADRRAARLIS